MIKQTNYLVAGDVMASGEIVKDAYKGGVFMKRPKMTVVLFNPKNGKTRLASWNYYGTVAVNSSVTTAGVIEKPLAPLDFSANWSYHKEK